MRNLVISVVLLTGCAAAGRPDAGAPTAKRLYTVGEQRLAAGRPDQAVALWRHAITQLPATAAYDELRHALILRLGHGQLVAHHATGKLAHLYDGRRTLERYLAKHEALFGDGAAAKAARGQVYELLYEFESRIDAPAALATPADTAAAEPTPAAAAAAPTSSTAQPVAAPPSRRRAAAPLAARTRGKAVSTGDHRVVIVDTRKLGRTSVDDPVLRRELARWQPEQGLVLTAPTVVPWLPARAYVRLDGLARVADRQAGLRERFAAHGVAAAVIRSVRPALRACYDDVFARAPAEFATATVEFSIDAQGRVTTPRIVEGAIGDGLGDICVLERLAVAKAEPAPSRPPMRVAVPLLFFYDGAVAMNEANGSSVRAGELAPRAVERDAVPRGLPPIDAGGGAPPRGPLSRPNW